MNRTQEIIAAYPEDVMTVTITKTDLHGEDATEVVVGLVDGRTVTGTFTSQPRKSFGGVQFAQHKDISGLMISKVGSVLRGTSDD